MRELKFRAWDKRSKKMIYGNDKEAIHFDILYLDEIFTFKWLDFMQFTGLLDARGKEIYEDDIITARGARFDKAVVTYKNGGFEPFAIAGWEDNVDAENATIIGNRFENPELLSEPISSEGK